MPAFLWLICAVIVILVVRFVSRILWLNTYVKHLPRVPFSMYSSFLFRPKSSTVIFKTLEKISDLYDGMTTMWLGPKLSVICSDPEDIRRIVMSKDSFNKSYVYHMMSLAGNGIFSASAHDWRPDRKSMNTVFTLSILKSFEPMLNHRFADLAKSLEKYVDQPESNFHRHIVRSNFSAVLATNFRYDYEAQNGSSDKFLDTIARMWEVSTMRTSSFVLHPQFFYRFSSLYAEEKIINNTLEKLAPKVISHSLERRKTYYKLPDSMASNDDDSQSILIDRLLELEERGLMDRQRILDQINTFIVAGTDTSAFTILNTLLLLAMNQDVQDRLYEELRMNITNGDYIEFETFSKMEYFDRVLKESMRLLPLTFFILRETDVDLELTQCTVPKGTLLVLNIWKLLRGEKIWGPTALEFDPDRFLPEAVAQRHPFAFLPFSAGPRNCIGFKYATNSMKVMLCHLLLRYKFTTSMRMDDLVFRFEFLLKLDSKFLFKLEKRAAL